MLFGRGAQVNVGGLVASTLDLNDATSPSAHLTFSGSGTGKVVNQGQLTAAPGGYVALLGGSAATLSFSGDRLVSVQVDQSTLNALAENRILIVADGGQVLMTAGARDSLLASVVNNTGVVEALTVQDHAGAISLIGGRQAGTVDFGGTLDASAPGGGDGGHIETSARRVTVNGGAAITTKAAQGQNGTWLIDPQNFIIAPSGGDVSGTALGAQLANGSVTIESSSGSTSGAGNIYVNDPVSWGANTLTLTAVNNININVNVNVNAEMSASGSAGLAPNPATANGAAPAVAGGSIVMALGTQGFGGRVNFLGANNTRSINGVLLHHHPQRWQRPLGCKRYHPSGH